MKLGPAFRDALSDARVKCGDIITVTVEAMGFRIVPAYLVDFFEKAFDMDDVKKANAPCPETDSHGVPCEMKGPHERHACPEALRRRALEDR